MSVALDRAFVKRWSEEYCRLRLGSRESTLLEVVGPRMRERGYAVLEDLDAVARWKAARTKGRVAKNSEDDVAAITSIAFAAPDRLKHRVLTLLVGVQVPMASAILTVWRPDAFTVIDFRSVRSLHRLGHLDSPETRDVSYPDYVALCRELASQHADTDSRRLDRALWEWSKQNYPT